MEILCLGVNYKTAPVEIREKLSIPADRTEDAFKAIEQTHVFNERLILSTCNRTEIYGVGDDAKLAIEETKKFLSRYSSLDPSDFEDKLYIYRQPQSIQHLFSVASGLDSMVVGETEIIGQVKDAYLTAHRHQQTGKVLNTLFQRSLKVAKNLRTQTEIGTGRVSVASVAVDLAEKIFEDLRGVRVVVLGVGEMAAQVVRAMAGKGARPLIVSTHHYEVALELARELQGEAIRYEDYETRIKEADILIGSTAATHAIVTEAQTRHWMKLRHNKPLFMIDIAVPRNIEASTEKVDNVYLYNIDDLKEIAEKNIAFRETQAEKCAVVVGDQTQYFMNWLFKEFGSKNA